MFISFYFILKLLGAWCATDIIVGKRRWEANYVVLERDRKLKQALASSKLCNQTVDIRY